MLVHFSYISTVLVVDGTLHLVHESTGMRIEKYLSGFFTPILAKKHDHEDGEKLYEE